MLQSFASDFARSVTASCNGNRISASNMPFCAFPVHVKLMQESQMYHGVVVRKLIEAPERQGGLYAGIGGMMNYTYLSAARAQAGLLFDINPAQAAFHTHIIDLLGKQTRAEDFRNALIASAPDLAQDLAAHIPGPRLFILGTKEDTANAFTDWIRNQSDKLIEGKWLHNEADYQHLHTLAKTGALATYTMDIRDENQCRQAGAALHGTCLPGHQKTSGVSLLYLSNVMGFLHHLRKSDFTGQPNARHTEYKVRQDLASWLNPDARIIECENLEKGRPLLLERPVFEKAAPRLRETGHKFTL